MKPISTVSDVFRAFEEYLNTAQGELSAKSEINQLRTGRRRFLASAYKGAPITFQSKMSKDVAEKADAILAKQPVKRLLELESDLQRGFKIMNAPRNSCYTYGASMDRFLKWAKEQPWFPVDSPLDTQSQCRPARRLSGRRHCSDLPLTVRSGHYTKYRLTKENTPPDLQVELDDFSRFLTDPSYPKRVCKKIKKSTANTYLKDIRLELGYFHEHLGVPLEELSLSLLFPVVTKKDLEGLSSQEQEDLWDEKARYVEEWTDRYFQDIKQRNNSLSPRTKNGKYTALQRLGHYLYRHQVRRKSDYDNNPILIALQERISQTVKVIQHWQKTRTFVADQDRKWPEVVEGETALTTLSRSVVEPLRLETRPRRKNGAFREGDVIAKSTQHYLKWAFITDLPSRRQHDLRNTRIALSCPVVRPTDVPQNQCYFPLPPAAVREKNDDGTPADNYLYKTYSYKGKLYPEGIYVLELCDYKTEETYGRYSMVIPNRQFDDGTCFYDYLEHYLCGWWMPGQFRDRDTYTWWNPTLYGKVGHWITKGWMEFDPVDLELVEEPRGPLWRWGYLFPLPETGALGDGTTFGGSFLRTSYQLLGKRITPHMVRYFWATWAFQMGLTDRELESLAYAMGHSVKTLRNMYERCTPEEKLRPIFEAIDRLRIDKLEIPPAQADAEATEQTLLRLAAELRRLSSENRQKVISMVGEA